MQCHVCVHRPVCCATLKNVTPPPTHTFLKWRFLADFKKYTHTPPPPQVTTCLHMEAKVVENAEKCQNPQSWHILNVPERYLLVREHRLVQHVLSRRKGRIRVSWGTYGAGVCVCSMSFPSHAGNAKPCIGIPHPRPPHTINHAHARTTPRALIGSLWSLGRRICRTDFLFCGNLFCF